MAVDPFTYESSWILDTGARVLRNYDQANVRVGFLSTSDAAEARRFLGDLADEFQVFVDPARTLTKSAGLGRLPSLLYIRQSGQLASAAEGWDPQEWAETLDLMEQDLAWLSRLQLPAPSDPAPYMGSEALA
ncbi:MAG: hypothetical protein ACC652_07000 [Acidimicrobiales bacterium]